MIPEWSFFLYYLYIFVWNYCLTLFMFWTSTTALKCGRGVFSRHTSIVKQPYSTLGLMKENQGPVVKKLTGLLVNVSLKF